MGSSYYHPMIERIKERVYTEMSNSAEALSLSPHRSAFPHILRMAEKSFSRIGLLMNSGEIDPSLCFKNSVSDFRDYPPKKALRLGFYPVAANPFHWAHLLIGLSAISTFKLDQVVYIIAGSDQRKPHLLHEGVRHYMAQEVLRLFNPLFAYSSIAMGSNYDGETNLFRILQLNSFIPIDAFYIAGADHYHRINPQTKREDTILKIEEAVAIKGNWMQETKKTISAIFIEREQREEMLETTLNVHFLPAMPFKASSTIIRETLQGKGKREVLSLLPYSAYQFIKAHNLYSTTSKKERTEVRYQNLAGILKNYGKQYSLLESIG